MLPRSQRLSVKQFNFVMEKGRAYHSTLFLLRVCLPPISPNTDHGRGQARPGIHQSMENRTRVAASVPNKVAKKAVERNRMRREMYETIRPLYPNLKSGQYIVVFAKNGAMTAKHEEITTGMREIFVKAGLFV